jgi:hypothetical protein
LFGFDFFSESEDESAAIIMTASGIATLPARFFADGGFPMALLRIFFYTLGTL